jgi:PAS domain S-box-containing protein
MSGVERPPERTGWAASGVASNGDPAGELEAVEPLETLGHGVSSELLDLLLAVMPDAAVAVDGDGRIVAVNARAEDLFGYPAEELVGRAVELLVPERFRHLHRDERTAYSYAPQPRPMGAGLDLSGRHRDATEFPVEISLAPVGGDDRPLVIAAVRDTSERKAATAAQAQLAAIVQSTLDAIVAMTLDGTITSWNPGATRLLGYAPNEMIGQHISRLLPADGSPELEELLSGALAGHPASPLDTQWLTKGGDELDLSISVSPLRDRTDQVAGFSVLARDITTRKLAEAQLRQQERLQAATAEIRLSMLADTPLSATFDLICRRGVDLLDADSMLIVLVEGGGHRAIAGAGDAVPLTGLMLDPPPSVVTDTLRSGTTQTAAAAGDPLDGIFGGPQAGAPVRSSRSPGGTLVAMRSPAGRPFAADEIAVLEDLASAAALGTELARAREDREHVLLIGDRERIARDLHDLVIQRLFGTGMGLQGVLTLIDNPTAAERVARAVDDLDATIREIRTAIFALETPPGAASGVRAEILQLVESLGPELGFEPAVHFDGPVDNLVTEQIKPHLLAVAREALSNIAHHAHASRAELDLSVGRDVSLVVVDDGVGVGDPTRRSGLANMRVRAETLGGTLRLDTPAGGGTRVEWRVPASGPG